MSETITDNQITITEDGAFIPRSLFNHEAEIVETLREAGVFSAPNGQTTSQSTTPKCEPVRCVDPIDLSREMNWLKAHRGEYPGQWVALDGDRLIAHGAEAREVYQAARAAGLSAPFVEQILPTDDLPFGGW